MHQAKDSRQPPGAFLPAGGKEKQPHPGICRVGLGIKVLLLGENCFYGPTRVPGAPEKEDSTSMVSPCSLASSTLRSWSTWAPLPMS